MIFLSVFLPHSYIARYFKDLANFPDILFKNQEKRFKFLSIECLTSVL